MPPAKRGIRIDESVRSRGAEPQAIIMRENAPAPNAAVIEKGAAGRTEITYIVMSALIANERLPRRDISVGDFDRTAVGSSDCRVSPFEQRQTSIWRVMLQREQPRGLRFSQHPRTTPPEASLRNCSGISLPRLSENQRITLGRRRRRIVGAVRSWPGFVELRPFGEFLLKVILTVFFAYRIKLVTDRPRRRRGRHHENRLTQFRRFIWSEAETGSQSRLRRLGLPDWHTRQADGPEATL